MAYTDYTVQAEQIVPLTDAQYQALALDECNLNVDPEISSSAVTNMPLWWSMYSNKGQLICYWYCRRSVCAFVLGRLRKSRDMRIGLDTFKNSDLVKNLVEMIKFSQTEIDRLDPENMGYVESFIPDTYLQDSAYTEALYYGGYGGSAGYGGGAGYDLTWVVGVPF